MKKTKQILAIIGVVLLVALYVSTLVFALIGSDLATNCLKASIYATVVVPVLIWAYTMVYRLLKNLDKKKLLLMNLPYVLAGYFCDKIAWLWRVSPGQDASAKTSNEPNIKKEDCE